ncbi:hypothetical protein C7H11_10865 [Escherichia coli]|nr:hypothetical protein C7H11_10865 [Escherichia coli]
MVARAASDTGSVPDATLLNCTPNVGHNLTSEGAVYDVWSPHLLKQTQMMPMTPLNWLTMRLPP